MNYIFVKKQASTPPPATLWTPSNLASAPRLWVRADMGVYDSDGGGSLISTDGTAVRRWEDQGGILDIDPIVSATYAARAPTWHSNVLNGHPVVRFRDETYGNPTGTGMVALNSNIYADNPSSLAFFVVARRTTQHTGTVTHGSGTFVSVGGYLPAIAMPGASTTTQTRNITAYWTGAGGVSQYTGEYASGWDVQPLIGLGEWVLVSHQTRWAVSSGGFQQIIRVDGGSHTNTPAALTPTAELGTAARHVVIGGRNQYANESMDGEIAEVVYCQGQDWSVSTVERDKVEGYLAHRYGLTASLPANHPYKDAAPTV